MKVRTSPGVCCCDEVDACLICVDDFNRGSTTDINLNSPCGWAEQLGDLSILNNALGGSGIARMFTTHPDAAQPGYQARGHVLAIGYFNSPQGNNGMVVCFDYDNVSSFAKVEVMQRSTDDQIRVRVADKSGTIEDVVVANPTGELTVSICVDYDTDRIDYVVRGYPSGTPFHGNSHTGVTLGNSGAVAAYLWGVTTPSFDSFGFYRASTELPECLGCEGDGSTTCVCCPTGFADDWSADLTGFAMTDSPYWTACDEVNGIYVLSWNQGDADCTAEYRETFVDSDPGCIESPGPHDADLSLLLSLVQIGQDCRLRLFVVKQDSANCPGPTEVLAIYEKSGAINELCSGSHTLNLITNNVGPFMTCQGTIPATVNVTSL